MRRRSLFAFALFALPSCDAPPDVTRDEHQTGALEAIEYVATERAPEHTPASDPAAVPAAVEQHHAPSEAAPPPVRVPVAVRIARQMLILRDAPDHGAPIRGRIPIGEAFDVFAYVDGPDCGGKGWGDVGEGAFVCLEPTRRGQDAPPRMLPELRDGDLAPFFYAKVRSGQVARRWASLSAWQSGEPNVDVLEPEHDYAFVSRRRSKGELVLIDADDRVVLEKEVTRYRPSRFEGRDLAADPVPEGQMLAWTVTWPSTPIMAAAAEDATVQLQQDYQAELLLQPTADPEWFAVVGGGFVHDKHVGRMVLVAPPADVADDEVWIDVELEEQVLTVLRGSTPLFSTLVSTGFKGPTPKGLFRIWMKQAIGQMQSRPDAEESYNVEAVPFVQYFSGNFALHGAFWHYRFGHRISHGCVNLSPRDARRVYEMTTPHARAGWLHAFEGERALGTTVRIRKGDAPVEDKREAVRRFDG
ncbi:MAG: L,D-transpeptidase [Nannocystaceae bacterium]|nr:L,D-transpeptidase [Nannocystaceae bacterium]